MDPKQICEVIAKSFKNNNILKHLDIFFLIIGKYEKDLI